MPWLDLFVLLLLLIGAPCYDRWVDVPRFRRWLSLHPENARRWWYRSTCLSTLGVTALACLAWRASGRGWAELGLRGVSGWRLWSWLAVNLLLALSMVRSARRLAQSSRRRERLAARLTGGLADYVPHSDQDAAWIVPVSLSAGFGEELLYRGFAIGALAPWLSWWGAAAVSVVAFGLAHFYQGRAGIVRTGIGGAVLALLVAATGSLLPAMALHATIDVGNLFLLWIAVRAPHEEPAPPTADCHEALPQT